MRFLFKKWRSSRRPSPLYSRTFLHVHSFDSWPISGGWNMQHAVEAPREVQYRADSEPIELSVVIPCLNEAETIGVCVAEALEAMAAHRIHGEVVVSDNGSTDD